MNKIILSILTVLTSFCGSFNYIIGSRNWNLYKLKTLYYTKTQSESDLYLLIDNFLKNYDSIENILENHNAGS